MTTSAAIPHNFFLFLHFASTRSPQSLLGQTGGSARLSNWHAPGDDRTDDVPRAVVGVHVEQVERSAVALLPVGGEVEDECNATAFQLVVVAQQDV